MASNTIGQLLVEIGLDSSKFNPELKKITNNIKGLEKDLRNMSKEFGDVGKSITGLEKKQELLNKVLSENNKAMNEHVKTRDNYADMLRKEKEELDALYSAEERDEKAIIRKEKSIQSLINKYNKEENAINKIANTNANYQKQLDEVNEQYNRLVNNIETYDEKLESISERTSLTNSELKAQQTILEATGKNWKAYNTQAQIVENSLASAIETYKTHREELSKSETELSKLTDVTEAHRQSLVKEQSTLQDILRIHGETSEEYQTQANYVERLTRQQIEYEQALVSTQEHVSKVKQSLASSKEEVAEYYQNLKEVGSTEITRNLKQTSNVLESVSEATKGVSAVGTGVGTGATAMFMTYESGLAKLSTLVDTSVVDMDKVGQDIIRISNETGTSIGEMMEGAYQAVSAGVDIGNINEFLSTSSKLATSGFTDMSSATKVLSQIMNNYGTSAGNAEEIASKLMKTQNLGVTTVAELSSEMSESLSLASTFGMSFDNVATAFAKMTKAGTSTNEAGTAIARMLEELGDTGSQVSQILKDKTGKSFTELAEGGSSLFDILTILQEHADETGVSMTELWGSSNAGVGALQLLSSEGGTFNDMLKEISNSSGLLDESFGKMSDTAEFKLSSAINNLKNSLIEIGEALAPVIEGISSAISGLANWINGLGDGTKTAIGWITGFTAVLSPLLGIVGKVVGGLGNLTEMFAGTGIMGNLLGDLLGDTKLGNKAKEIGESVGKTIGKTLSIGVGEGAKTTSVDVADTFKDELEKANKKNAKANGINIDVNKEAVVETVSETVGEAIEEGIEESSKKKISITPNVDTSATKKVAKEVTEEIVEEGAEAIGGLATQGAKASGIFSKLWGVMSAHPLATVAAGVGLVAGAVYLYNKYQDELNHQHRNNLAVAKEEIATHEANIQSYEQQISNVKQLVSEYEELNNKKNRTNEEEERRKQLLQEIAELSPNSVEYDANNDPVALKNDKIQEYIENLEIAMGKEQVWLNKSYREQARESQGALEEKYKETYEPRYKELLDKYRKVQPNYESTKGYINGREFKVEEEKLYDGSWIAQADGNNEKLKSMYDERSAKIKEYLDIVEEEKMLESEYALDRKSCSDDICDSIQNEIDYRGYLNDTSEQQKSTYDNFMSTMDFSEINTDYLLTYSKQFAEVFANMDEADLSNINNLLGEVNSLNQEVANGSIPLEDAEKRYEGLIDKISELTGLDKELVGGMIKGPEFDASSIFNATNDIETAKVRIAQALMDLTQIEDQDLRLDMAIQLANDKSLPLQVREAIAEAMADGEITDEEIEMILNINAELGEDDIEETVNEAFDNLNIDTIDKAITVGLKVEDNGDLNEFLNGLGLDQTKLINIKTAITGDDWKGLAKEIKDLPTEQQVAILTAIANSGAMTPEQLASMLQELPEEVRSKITTEYGDSLLKCAEVDSALRILEQRETTVEIHGESGSAQAEIDQIRNETIGDKTVKINGDSSDVEKKKKEAEKGTESPHTIKGDDTDVKNKKGEAQKGTSNTHKIFCDNSSVAAAIRENRQNTSSYHKIYVQEVLQGKVSVRSSAGGGGRLTMGVSDPVIVPMEAQAVGNPIIVDDFNKVVTQAQSSLMTTANSYKNTQNEAIATVQAKSPYTDTILASTYWANQSKHKCSLV